MFVSVRLKDKTTSAIVAINWDLGELRFIVSDDPAIPRLTR